MELVRAEPDPHAPTDRIRLVEYTDPISVWCWGCEPAIRRIEYRYPDSVDVVYRMGGLFEDFEPMREYFGRMSGGRWKEASLTFLTAVAGQHRMPMNPEAMMEAMDDFRSTWPGCVAVKAAERIGREEARRYLRRLREAVLVEGRPIHHRDVQLAVAARTGLDVDRFADALDDGSAERAFRDDLAECRARGITGFPTFELHRGPASLRMEGYQSWESFEEALRALDPDLRARALEPTPAAVLELLRHYERCASREIAAVFGVTDDEADLLLDEMAVKGEVVARTVGPAVFWEPPK
jgi:predicted DsbA family dithiol-disulfide isomerase